MQQTKVQDQVAAFLRLESNVSSELFSKTFSAYLSAEKKYYIPNPTILCLPPSLALVFGASYLYEGDLHTVWHLDGFSNKKYFNWGNIQTRDLLTNTVALPDYRVCRPTGKLGEWIGKQTGVARRQTTFTFGRIRKLVLRRIVRGRTGNKRPNLCVGENIISFVDDAELEGLFGTICIFHLSQLPILLTLHVTEQTRSYRGFQ